MTRTKSNPRYKNGNKRRKMRARFKAMGLPCAICGRPIHYDEPSDSKHPLSFVIDEILPVSRYGEFGFLTPTHAATDPDNVQPVHWICNARKGARTMREIGGSSNAGVPVENKTPGTQPKQNMYTVVNLPDGDW